MSKIDWGGTPFGFGQQQKAGGKSGKSIKQQPQDIESFWRRGRHLRSDGTEVALVDLPQTYLRNIMRKYSSDGFDTSAIGLYVKEDNSNNQ